MRNTTYQLNNSTLWQKEHKMNGDGVTPPIEAAEEILKNDSKIARWIANDAIRELTGEKVQNRLKKKK